VLTFLLVMAGVAVLAMAAGVNLTDLNNYMKNFPSGRIVPETIQKVPLLEALRDNIDRESFRGEYIEVLIQTDFPYTGQGFKENDDLPAPETVGFEKMLIPLAELIVTAGVSKQAMDRATGGASSWGNVVDLALKNQRRDWDNLLEVSCAGNKSGAVARVKEAADAGSPNVVTVTCDNTYTDSGIENVQQLKKGMKVDIWDPSGEDYRVQGVKITAVTFGDRKNGAATTGTFTFTHAVGHGIVDNDIVYLAESKDKLPMGVLGLVQDGSHYTAPFQVPTFQGLARGDHPSLRSLILQATDFGLESEAPVDGVPTAWDLSVISDAISAAENGGGGGEVNLLAGHGDLCMAIDRRNRAENTVTVNVSSTARVEQAAVGSRYAGYFITPDGRRIPIKPIKTLPRNVLVGLTLEDLAWHPLGDYDFLREYGDIWEPARGGRKTNYEAPYGGYHEISANRCDNFFAILDMRTNI